MGEKQEPEVLGEDGFPVEPGEGETAPESLNAPAETGEGDEGEGAGEGEGSKETGGAWSKEKAVITRLQQEKAELATKVAEAEKRETVANMRAELERRQVNVAAPAKAAETLSDDEKAADDAVDRIVMRKTGMTLDQIASSIGKNAQGVGSAAVATQDVAMQADPDAFPHYAEVRDQLQQYAATQGAKMTPEGYRFAYSEMVRPLATAERKTRRAATAKAKTDRRAALDGAPLPGGGRSTSGGNRAVSKADIGDMSDDDLADALDAAVLPDRE